MSEPQPTSPPAPAVSTQAADAVVPVTVGTVLWGVALVVLVVLRGTLEAHDADWWVATAATGLGFGLWGCWWVRRRRALIARRAAAPPTPGPS